MRDEAIEVATVDDSYDEVTFDKLTEGFVHDFDFANETSLLNVYIYFFPLFLGVA